MFKTLNSIKLLTCTFPYVRIVQMDRYSTVPMFVALYCWPNMAKQLLDEPGMHSYKYRNMVQM